MPFFLEPEEEAPAALPRLIEHDSEALGDLPVAVAAGGPDQHVEVGRFALGLLPARFRLNVGNVADPEELVASGGRLG